MTIDEPRITYYNPTETLAFAIVVDRLSKRYRWDRLSQKSYFNGLASKP